MKTTKTKAIAAGVTTVASTFLATLIVALDDGTVSDVEWLKVALAVVAAAGAAFGVTYAAPANKPVTAAANTKGWHEHG